MADYRTIAECAAALGSNTQARRDTLTKAAARNGWRIDNPDGDGRTRYLYDFDALKGYHEGAASGPAPPVDAPHVADDDDADVMAALLRDQSSPDWVTRGRYIYDGERDTYIFTCSSHPAPFVRSGEWVRSLWRRYTGGTTIDEVCRRFALDRQLFMEIKTGLRLTKTRAPFTDEELASGASDDLVQSALRAKEREVMTRVERQSWEATKRDAARFRELEMWRDEVVTACAEHRTTIPRGPRIRLRERPAGVVVVVEADAHVDMLDHHGNGAEVHAEAARRVRSLLASRVLNMCQPQRLIYTNGGDLSNADNTHRTTTNGTPQRMGLPQAKKWPLLLDYQDEAFATWGDTCDDVTIAEGFGNHDEDTGQALFWMGARTWGQRFTFLPSHNGTGRTYMRIGSTGVCLAHGDKVKGSKIADVLAYEWPGDYRRRVIVTGHEHHTHDDGSRPGVRLIKVPALSSESEWSAGHGYVGDRGWTALVFTPEGDLIAPITAYVHEVAAELYPGQAA